MPRDDRWAALKQGFAKDARPGTFTPDDAALRRGVEQPGAVSAVALPRPIRARARRSSIRHPLVIWGDRDRYLLPSCRAGAARLLMWYLDASTWVHTMRPTR